MSTSAIWYSSRSQLMRSAFNLTYTGSMSSVAVACSVMRQQNVPPGHRRRMFFPSSQ